MIPFLFFEKAKTGLVNLFLHNGVARGGRTLDASATNSRVTATP